MPISQPGRGACFFVFFVCLVFLNVGVVLNPMSLKNEANAKDIPQISKQRSQTDDLNHIQMLVLLRRLATKQDFRILEYHEQVQMSLAKPPFLIGSSY